MSVRLNTVCQTSATDRALSKQEIHCLFPFPHSLICEYYPYFLPVCTFLSLHLSFENLFLSLVCLLSIQQSACVSICLSSLNIALYHLPSIDLVLLPSSFVSIFPELSSKFNPLSYEIHILCPVKLYHNKHFFS